MPPKRKALADTTSSNKQVGTKTRNRKASKTSSKAIDPLSKKPEYANLQWPNIGDFINDKKQDMPKKGQLIDDFCYRVSDLGIPVSLDGAGILDKIEAEHKKRNQDLRDMFIYNDWNGWAMSEVLENFLKDFNKDIFKKTVSTFKKWAYVEAIACFFKSEDSGDFLSIISPLPLHRYRVITFLVEDNEDGDCVVEIVEMLDLMVLTTFSALSEHDLFKSDSEILNIGIISLLLLEFIHGPGVDLDCGWGPEVVRLCDEAGIDLDKEVRKQVYLTRKDLKLMRDEYKETEEVDNSDIAQKWKLEFKEFKKNHTGGNQYVIAKMSKNQIEAHTLGTKAFDRRIGIDTESDDSQ
ncbi:hypothetical protein LSUE1_G000887 [Lachnellula suecica]|uniref:Uncharacterized protein n=1 Tax=Lachnellula suecica TaxID=602035 RepID=A0A8T9CFS3_9HELO|nr:hypothetical protein LSUE1_G000887 [Lachnellula suecica]